jgi:hypothetical protein
LYQETLDRFLAFHKIHVIGNMGGGNMGGGNMGGWNERGGNMDGEIKKCT